MCGDKRHKNLNQQKMKPTRRIPVSGALIFRSPGKTKPLKKGSLGKKKKTPKKPPVIIKRWERTIWRHT